MGAVGELMMTHTEYLKSVYVGQLDYAERKGRVGKKYRNCYKVVKARRANPYCC